MNLTIGILEDDPKDYESLNALLSKWAADRGHILNLYWFQGGEELLSFKKLKEIHILFSDIELKPVLKQSSREDADHAPVSLNGIKVCDRLRKQGFKREIVFLTAFREYVFEGYDVQAFRFLLKPLEEKQLFSCMDKILSLHGSDFYYHHKGDKIIQIPYNDIISVNRVGHDCILQTPGELYSERASLADFEARLPGQFIRCHKSCIVNIYHIKSLSGLVLRLSNGNVQAVGRSHLEQVRNALIRLADGNFQ